jgi:ADP-heptose:LPS heptosyltransferase
MSLAEERSQRHIVIFRQGSIGDFLVSLPCLHAIRKLYSGARIILLTNQATNSVTVSAQVILDGTLHVADSVIYI